MDKIAVTDFGCQYTHQIAEKVRKAKVFSEIFPDSEDVSFDDLLDYNGIVLSGGPDSVYKKGAPRCDNEIFSGKKPVLEICYGMQLMVYELGGVVEQGEGEYGKTKIKMIKDSPILKGLNKEETVWMSHGDSVIKLPEGFEAIAISEAGKIAAIQHKEKPIYGLQFHPEVSHTDKGDQIIKNFAVDICGCKQEWTPENYIKSAVRNIKDHVGDGLAKVLVSGGVDSGVAYFLTIKALGKNRVTGIHVDNGLERKHEAEWVRKSYARMNIDLEVINTYDFTLKKIGRTVHPEKKRHKIGNAFIEALNDKLDGFYVVQGTIYPDRVESGKGVGKKEAVIKTHHNVGVEEIEKLIEMGMLIEPNRFFFKHETRELGRKLGLLPEISERHPFPGPGFGVRIVGNVYKPKGHTQICESAYQILDEYDLEGVVVPLSNVGVKGSARAYASFGLIYGEKEEYDKIREASNKLGNNLRGVTRAAMFLDGEKYSQEGWDDIRRMPITEKRLELLREADYIAMENLKEHGLYKNISQMPVILFPGPEKIPWVAIRPVVTPDFMTLRPPKIPGEMTWEYFDETVKEIMELPVGGVVLDTTNKPPGTTEWE